MLLTHHYLLANSDASERSVSERYSFLLCEEILGACVSDVRGDGLFASANSPLFVLLRMLLIELSVVVFSG